MPGQRPATALWARQDVQAALAEDLGPGDLLAGLGGRHPATARILAGTAGVLAGQAWVEAALAATCAGQEHSCDWQVAEGEEFAAATELAVLSGPVDGLLLAERVALNFLQLLSGVATAARAVATAAAPVPVYDTRKTLPKLRAAQKHAAEVGGLHRNRATLHEAAIIKDNHIAAAGSVAAALRHACTRCAEELIQVEVSDMDLLRAALAAGAKRIMLDNFTPEQARAAVTQAAGAAELEATGGITAATAAAYAASGVDRLSCGSVTKNVVAVDLSLELAT